MREVRNMTRKTFGVIGVCGANGNLIARLLSERGYDVIGTDLSSAEECRFAHSLDGYDIELFYGGTPDEFFEKAITMFHQYVTEITSSTVTATVDKNEFSYMISCLNRPPESFAS